MLLTKVLTFLEIFILGHYDPPSTKGIQHLATQTTNRLHN